MSRTLLRQAIERFGSQEKLAWVLATTQPAVARALKTGRIPPVMAYRIFLATGGEFELKDLCPDFDPELITRPRPRRRKGRNGRGR